MDEDHGVHMIYHGLSQEEGRLQATKAWKEQNSWSSQPITIRPRQMDAPCLPAEVWRMVFGYIGEWKSQRELTYLWMTLRNVCRIFRAEVHAIFEHKHMGFTDLCFHFGQSLHPSNELDGSS